MDLRETLLRPGELAVHIDTGNHTVDLGRLLGFLDCLIWEGPPGLVPAYDLSVIDLRRGSIFARFALGWRGKAPDEARLDRIEQEILQMRSAIDATAVRMADAAEDQVRIARTMLHVTIGGLALTAMGIVFNVAGEARDEEPSECAAAISDLIEKDHAVSIKVWTPDCAAIIRPTDMPEMKRRSGGIRIAAAVGRASGSGDIVGAVVDGGFFGDEDPTSAGFSDGIRFRDGSGFATGPGFSQVAGPGEPPLEPNPAFHWIQGYPMRHGDKWLISNAARTENQPFLLTGAIDNFKLVEGRKYNLWGSSRIEDGKPPIFDVQTFREQPRGN